MRSNAWNGCAAMLAAACVAAGMAGCQKEAPQPQVSVNGHTWTVELAMTTEDRAHGLGDRAVLAADHGMLFVYPSQHVMGFWMKACHFPIDVAFVDSQMRVVAVKTMRVELNPDSDELPSYSSEMPAQFALEVNAGELAKAGVKKGDVVTFAGVDVAAAKDDSPGGR